MGDGVEIPVTTTGFSNSIEKLEKLSALLSNVKTLAEQVTGAFGGMSLRFGLDDLAEELAKAVAVDMAKDKIMEALKYFSESREKPSKGETEDDKTKAEIDELRFRQEARRKASEEGITLEQASAQMKFDVADSFASKELARSKAAHDKEQEIQSDWNYAVQHNMTGESERLARAHELALKEWQDADAAAKTAGLKADLAASQLEDANLAAEIDSQSRLHDAIEKGADESGQRQEDIAKKHKGNIRQLSYEEPVAAEPPPDSVNSFSENEKAAIIGVAAEKHKAAQEAVTDLSREHAATVQLHAEKVKDAQEESEFHKIAMEEAKAVESAIGDEVGKELQGIATLHNAHGQLARAKKASAAEEVAGAEAALQSFLGTEAQKAGVKAITETAEGVGALAQGIWPPNPAALAAATTHFSSAAMWAGIGGAAAGAGAAIGASRGNTQAEDQRNSQSTTGGGSSGGGGGGGLNQQPVIINVSAGGGLFSTGADVHAAVNAALRANQRLQ